MCLHKSDHIQGGMVNTCKRRGHDKKVRQHRIGMKQYPQPQQVYLLCVMCSV